MPYPTLALTVESLSFDAICCADHYALENKTSPVVMTAIYAIVGDPDTLPPLMWRQPSPADIEAVEKILHQWFAKGEIPVGSYRWGDIVFDIGREAFNFAKLLYQILIDANQVPQSYSGTAMYGARRISVVSESDRFFADMIICAHDELEGVEFEKFVREFLNYRSENMGLQFVYYWPTAGWDSSSMTDPTADS